MYTAERSLGLDVAQVSSFIDNQLSVGAVGRPIEVKFGDRPPVWGRVLADRDEYFGGFPSSYQPRGTLGQSVYAHMELWESSGLLVPGFQVVERGEDIAVFTDAVTGVQIDEAPPEDIGKLGTAIGKAVLGNGSVRSSLTAIMEGNFVHGSDTSGREGMFMVDTEPYVLDASAPLTSGVLARIIKRTTELLCDTVGGTDEESIYDKQHERRIAVNGFMNEFFPAIESLPHGQDLEVITAIDRAIIYRDTGARV